MIYITLVIFWVLSTVFFLMVTVMEVMDLIQLTDMDINEIQDSILNILLFSIPILHSMCLFYIYLTRRRIMKRAGESESEAANHLTKNKYGQQVDDVETMRS